MSAFTPAPWGTNVARLSDDSILVAHVVAQDRASVAQVSTYGEEETVANARLIAAAPDLFAALEPLLAIIDEGVSVNISDSALREAHPEDRAFIKRTRAALSVANAAIAKARGDQ